jgi:hypothetical protein
MRQLTTQLTDRHELTYENQKLQGKYQGANGGSVQRLVRQSKVHRLKTGARLETAAPSRRGVQCLDSTTS